ncbi:MAG: alpha/beta hydrolase, partial [Comamonas sp.]
MPSFRSLCLGGLLMSSLLGAHAATTTADTANAAALPGYAPGAQILRVDSQRGQIDQISGVIYSQIASTRAVRQLRMSLLVPRTTDLKPAVVYFPG